jgi:signal peptidase I
MFKNRSGMNLRAVLICIACLFVNHAHAQNKKIDFGNEAMRQLEILDKNGARVSGTYRESETANYIINYLGNLGYNPIRQKFHFDYKTPSGMMKITSENIIVSKQGAMEKELILCAHYDSVDQGNGTDDNASGVALLLEMSNRIRDIHLKYSVKIIFFGAEEYEGKGSDYYASQMKEQEISNIYAVLNFDSLIAGEKMYVYGDFGEKGIIRDWILKKGREIGIDIKTQEGKNTKYPYGTTGDWGDHVPFKNLKLQYAYFESTNWNLGEQDGYTQVQPHYGEKGKIWHTKYDTLDYIDKTFPNRIKEYLSGYSRLLYLFLTEFNSN